ncbi:hypothetical protein LCGC14_1352520 [marine sediment metagenome]|uniref:Uncharacterized protein n=1 Tax=marine sediment metagenome TaxID=412755 RepID=A0A0F9MR32_9ZZZZ
MDERLLCPVCHLPTLERAEGTPMQDERFDSEPCERCEDMLLVPILELLDPR